MVDTYFGANLIDYNTVKVALFTAVQKSDNVPINLIINDERIVKLEVKKQVFLGDNSLYTCYFSEGFELGNSYKISIENYGVTKVNVENAVDFPDFDDTYFYFGDDLGVTYKKEETTFKLWAPLASKVKVFLRKTNKDEYTIYQLKRGRNGVYSLTLKGDYEGYLYLYEVTNSEVPVMTLDPYGKGSTANSKENVVIDFNKVEMEMYDDVPKIYKSYLDTIIYELDVRDFTIDENTDIVNKGKFLGLTEENRKTKHGFPAGLDYLSFLGVTHVQILPMYDFKTIDELNTKDSYNWGYDPWQYFCVEGSYSTNPDDPYSRIKECKMMISALHKKGIKVNMDVVYNHVYDGLFSCYERVVPNYFFRKRKNGFLCNGTGCGNDVDSEKPMVRKLIIDCIKHWINEYHIDGLRFDLMGILDVATMNQIAKITKKMKSDFMIYGEGWDMNTELPSDKKASILNSFKMPEVAFFNDTYRDTLKGINGVDKLQIGGYLTGDLSFVEGFKFVYLSSSLNFVYPARFMRPSQSLNYVECHDNFTLFDKVSSIYGKNETKKVMNIIRQINGIILLSFGVPFFHAGQEIGLSKYYEDNTYNMGDKYNKFRYDVLDDRFEYATYFKTMIQFRKEVFKNSIDDPKKIGEITYFHHLENNLLAITVKLDKEYIVVINPTENQINYEFDGYYLMLCSLAGYLKNSDLYIKASMIAPHSVFVFEKKEELE